MKQPLIALCSLLALLTANVGSAAPANDAFANRTVLSGTNLTVTGSNGSAGSEPGEDTGNDNIVYCYSVWYEWTAPTQGVLYVSASSTVWNFLPSLGVYRGTALSALTPASQTPDGGMPVTAGDTVVIRLCSIYYPSWGGGGGSGPFTLNLALAVPSVASGNDWFANRFDISTPTYHFEGGIVDATTEPGEPLPLGTSQTLWWKFVPPADGVLGVWPSTPQFTPVLTLYEGSSLETLTGVAPLNNYRYRVRAGHEYALQMASGVVPGGAVTLDTRFFSLTNDSFAGSTHLEGTNFTYVGNLTTATLEPNEPNPGYTNTIWVSWAAPCTGRARFSGTVVSWAQPMTVYTGPTLERLQPVRTVSMDNGLCDFLAVAGTVYHFQIAGTGNECTFSFQLFPFGPPTNDAFAGAHWLVGQNVNYAPYAEWFPIGEATAELGEPALLGGAPFKSVWWKWTAPVHGTAYYLTERSLATNMVLSAFQGTAVEALSLLGRGTNSLSFAVTGGNTYYLAAAVPTNAPGDVCFYGVISQSSASRPVPGNLLQEPSWEGTYILNAQYWHNSGGLGGAINEPGGCDGTTWPTLGTGVQIWQDIPTVPGRNYAIRFAMRANSTYVGGGSGDRQVRVLWDGQAVGVATLPAGEISFWHWATFTATASKTTSQVAFLNLASNIELDAFSVVALTEPPRMITQPTSASVLSGGTVAFVAGASGSAPLSYQWFFNSAPYVTLSSPFLVLEGVASSQAGTYQAVVSNPYGAVTSAPVTLTVEAPLKPVILWQPYGDTVGVGGYFSFSVVAAGTAPLTYQWSKDGVEVLGATNRTLSFSAVDSTNAGSYVVRVANAAGIVWSLNARLVVTNAIEGGGKLNFSNKAFPGLSVDAPVFDLDGVTLLNGSNYVAQLYGGPSLELLRPVGQPARFQSGFGAGYFYGPTVTLPTVAPGGNAVLQVRAWDATKGGSYEEARAFGGRFGKSDLFTVAVGGGTLPPANLVGLRRFSLCAGLPQFAQGQIAFVERQPRGVLVWAHRGEPGFRYVIEKSLHGFEWRPYLVLTNETSTVTFTDEADSGSSAVFYRSRILD